MAERYVQTFKKALQKLSTGILQTKLSRFIFKYRTIKQTTTGQSPDEILKNRKFCTHLHSFFPSIESIVQQKQGKSKDRHDAHAKSRHFEINDPVFVCNYGVGNKWMAAVMKLQTGPVSY